MNLMIFQLWEQSQMDNSRLRDDLAKTRDELSAAKKKLETAVQVRPINIKKCKGQKIDHLPFLYCRLQRHLVASQIPRKKRNKL